MDNESSTIQYNQFSINFLLVFAFAFSSLSASAQYLSLREERPKIDKINKNLFQVSINQEVTNSLEFKILINNPGQELLNVTLKDQDGKLFQAFLPDSANKIFESTDYRKS